MTAQYSEIKRNDMAPRVLPHTSTVYQGDYSVLKKDDIPLHNVTAGGDYSVISRDDIPYSTVAGGEYSVLKRDEREVS